MKKTGRKATSPLSAPMCDSGCLHPVTMPLSLPFPLYESSGIGRSLVSGKGIGGLSEEIELVEACRRLSEWSEAPWMLEHPVGVLSSYWRKPDHAFNPCDYGEYLDPPADTYTKKTCMWTGGRFAMPQKKPVEPLKGSKIHLMPPSEDRGDLRSITPEGFAKAVMLANARIRK